MNSVITFLSGKKTYIVAIATVLYAGVQYWSGAIDQHTAIQMALAACGLAGLRSGINKGTNK